MSKILLGLIAVLLVINVFISTFIAKRDDLEKSQKIAQIIMLWLIPYFGAIGLYVFHKSNDKPVSLKGPLGGGANDSIGASDTGGGH